MMTFDTYPDMYKDYENDIENENYDYERKIFTVPSEWAAAWVNKECEMSMGEFMDEYTWDDTLAMYEQAILDDVIAEEHIDAR